MSTLFNARRKPKRIARDEPGPDQPTQDNEEENGPVVRRPIGSAVRTKSKLRQTYTPGITDPPSDTADNTTEPQSKISRLGASLAAQRISVQDRTEERPTYSKAYLDELRNSQSSTPLALSSPNPSSPEPQSTTALDIASKFGLNHLPSTTRPTIPSTSEIEEKKARRARLALEHTANSSSHPHAQNPEGDDFIPLEAYDSDGEFRPQRLQGQVSTYLDREAIRHESTRLIPEDEDIAEGFDEFTEDSGRVTLSGKGMRRQERKRREEIRRLIEVGSDDGTEEGSESEGDLEAREEYEGRQLHRGLEGVSGGDDWREGKKGGSPKQPREVTAIPRLSQGLERLRGMISAVEFERTRVEVRRGQIGREREECKAEMQRIQGLLEEAGRELEVHLGGNAREEGAGKRDGEERGLESFGGTPTATGV